MIIGVTRNVTYEYNQFVWRFSGAEYVFDESGNGRYIIEILQPQHLHHIKRMICHAIVKGTLGTNNTKLYKWINRPERIGNVKKHYRKL